MLRMSRLTDYGIVLLVHLAAGREGAVHNARELAARAGLPLPVVSKVLKSLARDGLLDSHRGARGGYALALAPEHISVARVIDALEGPIALTECTIHPGACEQESSCAVRDPWQRINAMVRETLENVSLADLAHDPASNLIPLDTLLGAGGGAPAGGRIEEA